METVGPPLKRSPTITGPLAEGDGEGAFRLSPLGPRCALRDLGCLLPDPLEGVAPMGESGEGESEGVGMGGENWLR